MNSEQAKAFHDAFAEISAECEEKGFRLPNSTDFGFGWRKAEEYYNTTSHISEREGNEMIKTPCSIRQEGGENVGLDKGYSVLDADGNAVTGWGKVTTTQANAEQISHALNALANPSPWKEIKHLPPEPCTYWVTRQDGITVEKRYYYGDNSRSAKVFRENYIAFMNIEKMPEPYQPAPARGRRI